MLRVEKLSVQYFENKVLEDVSLGFPSGKITGIIGQNGAGKSTLLKGLMQLIPTKSGETFLNDVPLKRARKQIAYVEQRKDIDHSFPINVLEVVLTGTYAKVGLFNIPSKLHKEKAMRALEMVKMDDMANRQIGELSGGQLQRVFVARAIVQDCEVILLDEPFAGIDIKSEGEIIQILKKWKNEGKTVVVVHHDLNKVHEYFDELVLVNRGIVDQGATKDVFTKDNFAKAFGLSLDALNLEKDEQSGEMK